MKAKILTKIAIASMLCAPACSIERGVVIDRDESQGENALYVNLIRKNKAKQKPLYVQSDEIYDADRKLFFPNSPHVEPFVYILPGDTISFYNPHHKKYIYVNRENCVRNINGERERKIVNGIKPFFDRQR